ncbi:hypothetical protein F6A46_07500 [Tenacibaculum finnmarkense genomovar ulcerans]|uniref:hypothetical protein n=1 Tax=Tenacibaculum finnmarkense TaxID=2781243 RepID=UPI00187BA780|nr:hypothetical protein [Tenacibaculum finnmarkense]MBE7688076.1 hypothetical protein [Tenacibaculum finnmarkense genomovar ulcerans]
MNDLIQQANDFMTTNPEYGYLLVAVVLLIFSLGSFKKYNWAISPGSSYQRFLYSTMGEKWFSIIMGGGFLIGSLGALGGFLLSK